jgi:hypothetical protein
MGMDVPQCLHHNWLTTIEQYRKMQIKLHAMKKQNEQSDQSGKSEEWKNWELAPLDAPTSPPHGAGKYSGTDRQGEAKAPQHSAEAVNGLHKALRRID